MASSVTSTTSGNLSFTTSSALGTTHMNGLSSGLDIDSLVSATIQADSIPVTLLQNKNTKLQAQMNDYNSIKTALFTLSSTVSDLTYSSSLDAKTTTTSDNNVVTAAASTGAIIGTYDINVAQTATATHILCAPIGSTYATVTGSDITGNDANTAFSNPSVFGGTINAGSFQINGKTITVTTADTINTVLQQINSSSAGVTATLSGGKIVLTQKTAGAASTITVAADTSGFVAATGLNAAVQAGQNSTVSTGTFATITGTKNITNANANDETYIALAGTITINNKSISIDATDTVNTILNKISDSGAGIKATLSGGKVVLTQNTAGSTKAITLNSDSTGGNIITALGLTVGASASGTDSDEATTLQNTSSNALKNITAGYFSINGYFFKVDPTTDTLDSIISRINSSNAGVVAIYDANAKTISLAAKTAGSKQNITLGTTGVGGTDTSNFLDQVGLTAGTKTQGTDAQVTVNGVAVTPTNNTVTYNNTTFNIVGSGSATVTVNSDIDSIVTKVKSFISQYNTAIDQVNSKLNEKPDSTSNDSSVGDLFGDSTLRDVSQTLRSYSYSIFSTNDINMQQLSQVGITTGSVGQSLASSKTGELSLDESKLRAALEADPNAVAKLFGQSYISVGSDAGSRETASRTDGTHYQLAHGSVSSVQIWVNGVQYTQVSGTPKPDDNTANPPIKNQFSVDYTTGKITFGNTINATDQVTAAYDYDTSGSQQGLFVQMKSYLDGLTQVGGTFDAITGSDGSITNMMKYNNDRISELNDRLQLEQASLYTQYQAMESILMDLKSQQNFLTSQLASLSSSK